MSTICNNDTTEFLISYRPGNAASSLVWISFSRAMAGAESAPIIRSAVASLAAMVASAAAKQWATLNSGMWRFLQHAQGTVGYTDVQPDVGHIVDPKTSTTQMY